MNIIKTCGYSSLIFLGTITSIFAHGPIQETSITTNTIQKQSIILFQNVQVFNGESLKISAPMNVLVEGNKIQKISIHPITVSPEIHVINGTNKVLMPGLIDAHWHAMMAALPAAQMLTIDSADLNFIAAQEANHTLMRGFTSVRDLGGPVFSLKRAIDNKIIDGPRIWPSGSIISQTGGHADFRLPYEIPSHGNQLSRGEALGGGVIADGSTEVLKRSREQLMLGASQLKLAAGGGVSSHYDPIDVSQYTEDEFRAAVSAANNWGTYVSVHAYTPNSIKTAVKSGVKVIEHGQLMDDETAKLMAKNNAWLSSQAFIDNEFANPQVGENREKQKQVQAGTDKSFELAKKYKLNVAWGTDILFNPKMTKNQGALLTTMTRWYTPAEVLKMATSTNAKLLSLSGERSPYKGKLGVIEEGALADILLIDGNPIENIKLLADPEKNILMIMKDGVIYKNMME